MPRPKAPARKVLLTEAQLRALRPKDAPFMVWDQLQGGLGLRVQPTGVKSWKVAYRHAGRLRWYTIGRYGRIGLAEARQVARQISARAALGQDPQGDKVQARVGDTLEQVHQRYLEVKAKASNKSWPQADKLMRNYVLPKLGKRKIKDIARQDLWRLFDDLRDRPVLANTVLASASAVFSGQRRAI
jgi:Arm DNA-binding domain/Phage integrase, N-terminal SAM-like domain